MGARSSLIVIPAKAGTACGKGVHCNRTAPASAVVTVAS
jgi:hypothetical protein